MVEAIVRVGHVMQVKVIAEWVENEETLSLLKEMGVDYVQGYHLGVPREVKSV
jgi:EAL domain-containing protein (putative c-di-GMP-specific phosphodiesterase class I)